uniref:Uncharacterized protein n=1 Tax=Parascaris univalens TaxID=6257 RepID=A0A915AYB3_PARUN
SSTAIVDASKDKIFTTEDEGTHYCLKRNAEYVGKNVFAIACSFYSCERKLLRRKSLKDVAVLFEIYLPGTDEPRIVKTAAVYVTLKLRPSRTPYELSSYRYIPYQ